MTEQCQKCKREEQRYIILEIVEFDVGGSAEREEEDVTEISSCDGVTLCRTCWIEIKKNSSTLSEMIKYV